MVEKLDSFLEKIRQPQSPEKNIDIWYNLPLKDEGALQELEVKLKDENYRKKMVNINSLQNMK